MMRPIDSIRKCYQVLRREYHQRSYLTKLQCTLGTMTTAENSFRANGRLRARRNTRVLPRSVAAAFSECLKVVKRTRGKLKTLRHGSEQMWRLSAQLIDKSAVSSGIPALTDGDKLLLDAAGKANLLERTFALKSILQPIEVNEYSGLDAPLLTGGFLRIRHRDVLRVLRNLKEHRATGPDLLATCVLNAFA